MINELKLQRTREQWSKCDPALIAKMGGPAVVYALQDAKRDIETMHRALEKARAAHPAPESVGGVEVFAYGSTHGIDPVLPRHALGSTGEKLSAYDIPLMPVRQHNRSMAATAPAGSRVLLPERLDTPHRDEFESADQYAAAVGEAKKWNACLDEVARLNQPASANQCDGCLAGIPVHGGMHAMGTRGGYADKMMCTASRYQQPASGGDERAAFEAGYEAKARALGIDFNRIAFVRGADGLYLISSVQTGWWAWKTRAALPVREAVPKGYVLASKETLSRCAYNIAYAIFNLADQTLESLKPGVIESTDPATSALIAEREIRALLAAAPSPSREAVPVELLEEICEAERESRDNPMRLFNAAEKLRALLEVKP